MYFGIEGLNMRSRSSANFTSDDMRKIVEQCSARNVKTYLTVNTIVYDSDIELMREIIRAAKEAGVSAIIASDMAAILYAREIGQEVHISTQVNVTNIEAVKFYSGYADVMVLARELNLDQVRHIHEAITREGIQGPAGKAIRLEMFCHGALCMAVSGKCYMSLHEMNSSANRGACNQICRRSYTVRDRETDEELVVDNKFIMSPKDLKTIHFLDKMVDAGVRVFKIEGRARGPEYVREAVECYSEALSAVCDGTFSLKKWRNGIPASTRFSTEDSGTAITSVNALENGAQNTALLPPARKCMPPKPYAISRKSESVNSSLRQASFTPATRWW